ncbi:MAG TPA: N-carbamoylsarcosine amidase, partial [Alphaproteobacteria bacterium]|nr:N-carbamoylsarcosine amidase [Alphaproteobacteria bacterium]
MPSEIDIYKRQKFGRRLGFGKQAALLIVDFVNGFDDPEQFGGGNIS